MVVKIEHKIYLYNVTSKMFLIFKSNIALPIMNIEYLCEFLRGLISVSNVKK